MKIHNEEEFRHFMDRFIRGHPQAAANALEVGIREEIVPRAKKDHHRGRAHAMDRYEDQTVTLTRSTEQIGKPRVEGDKIIGKVGVKGAVDYARGIEYGTSKHQPYPFLRPAIAESAEPIKQDIKENLEKYGEEMGL